MLDSGPPIRLPSETPPQLMVVIDTEEEFDWSGGPDREAVCVRSMQYIERVQALFDQYGIVPCYVIDYPVANQEEGYRPLRELLQENRCEIGAHLHPWVNPPHEEVLSSRNMYPGNLPYQLQRRKLANLSERIETNLGMKPTCYKAGRYGLGPDTQKILRELGFSIDLSVCPPVDYRADGGPDYSRAHPEPYWIGAGRDLLEIPITGAFVGWAGSVSRNIYAMAHHWSMLKLPGIFSRLSLVDRLMLSPEGFSPGEHVKLTRYLLARGVRTFTWSFHSPSVLPGCTPYVANEQQLQHFLDSFRSYFDFFFDVLHGESSTPTRLKQKLELLA